MDSRDVRRAWRERSGAFSPTYYAHRGPDGTTALVRRLLERRVGRDASVLEVGCSSGRHLAALHDHGFTDLAGIEVNDDAVGVMEEAFPELADAATVHRAAVEDVVTDLPDGRFDAVFSVETLQHVHPTADWVFSELARIADGCLVTAENEGATGDDRGRGPGDVAVIDDAFPLYYRDWSRVFGDEGLTEVTVEDEGRVTVRCFRVDG